MQGTERENKLPEPWYGLKNWLITTHAPTERSVRGYFIESKKTNYENWFWKIGLGVLLVHSFPGLRAWNLSLLKNSLSVLMVVFCFCFHFSWLLCLYVCLRRGSPSSGAVLARSAITGSSKCHGNEILWRSGENSSSWMIIQCNYLYQRP